MAVGFDTKFREGLGIWANYQLKAGCSYLEIIIYKQGGFTLDWLLITRKFKTFSKL